MAADPISLEGAIQLTLERVTRQWKTAKRQADREQQLSERQLERLYCPERPVSIKELAFGMMPEAYHKASGEARFPANARQVMYAARPTILAGTDKPWGKSTDQYFTQTLLPDYVEQHPTETATWD